jgi:AraC family transcriptional regulator of adaptative response/methylated-DNA-[protein]-cysteine methyltransferase
VKGTPFQLAVWQELIQIPCTETISYGNLAQRIGRPDAARAVGSAVGRNPVACLIPCHRVLHSDSSLGGYHWGSELKVQLLRAEKAPFNQKTIHTTR